MTIEAKIILDSISPQGKRITTFQLTYPRFIHSEFMTHRMISKNAASSRAIPVETMLKRIEEDPAGPVWWGRNQKGMQAAEELQGEEQKKAIIQWLRARDSAVAHARELAGLGVHKQIVNRIVEPWSHMVVCATATEWDNLYGLRCHPAAQPEFQALAYKMLEAHNASEPYLLKTWQFHLPYLTEAEQTENRLLSMAPYGAEDIELELGPGNLRLFQLIKCSVARCARTSYMKQDNTLPNLDDDIAMYERLAGSAPKHASPLEHQATPAHDSQLRSGNFIGWKQYRKMVEKEYIERDERLLIKGTN